MRYVLSIKGHEVTLATSVADALAALAAAPLPPDLVVLDLMLPDGDGTDVLRAVRSSAHPAVPVAVTTGVMDPQWLARVEALRPDRILRKPIQIDELLKLL